MKGNRVAIGVRNARWGGFKITFLKVQTNMNHVKWLKLKRTATNILWTLIKKLTFWETIRGASRGRCVRHAHRPEFDQPPVL